jgi:hypothetical protein
MFHHPRGHGPTFALPGYMRTRLLACRAVLPVLVVYSACSGCDRKGGGPSPGVGGGTVTATVTVGADKDSSEKKVYTREEFRQLVMDKTPEEVIAAVGRPDSTQDPPGTLGVQHWYYKARTFDPVSNKTDRIAQVTFQGGIVSSVSY